MATGDCLERRANLLNSLFLDITEKLQRQMQVVDFRPRNFHAGMRPFQPRLSLAEGGAHLVRQVNCNECSHHFLSNCCRHTASASCDAKNLNVSRSNNSMWRRTSVRVGVARAM